MQKVPPDGARLGRGSDDPQVHIPEGARFDAWTGEEMTPGTAVEVAVPRYKIPIHVCKDPGIDLGVLAAGVMIPAGDPSGRRR